MGLVTTDAANVLAPTGSRGLWQRLRRVDRVLILLLMPVWLVCLILHIDLAIDDHLVRPAILFSSAESANRYPRVSEILSEAQELVGKQGIQVGDEILSINEKSLQGFTGYRTGIFAASLLGKSEEIVATFRRGDTLFTRNYPFNDFGIPRWWPSLFAISFGVVGLLVLLSAPASRTAQAIFPAFVFFALSWLVILGNSELQTMASTWLFAVSMVFAGPLLLRAILLLPEETAIHTKSVYGGVWFFSLMVVSGLSAFTGWPFNTAVGQGLHAAFMALFYLLILLILTRNYLKASTVGRRQLRWVILGFYFAFIPALIVSAVVINYPDNFSLYALASIGMPVVPLTFLVAITQYNLFDVDRIIGGSVSYSLLVIFVAVITEAVVEPLVAATGAGFGFDGDMVQLVFVGVVTAVLIPLERRWRELVNRVFFAQGVAVEQALTELIETVEGASDLSSDALFTLVGESLSSAYAVRSWGIFEVENDELQRINGNFCDEIPETIWRRYTKKLRPGSEIIGGSQACLVAPIRPHGAATALLVLGPKGSGDVYTTTDNGLVATLSLELADKLKAAS